MYSYCEELVHPEGFGVGVSLKRKKQKKDQTAQLRSSLHKDFTLGVSGLIHQKTARTPTENRLLRVQKREDRVERKETAEGG